VSHRFRLLSVAAALAASQALAAEPPPRERATALLAELDKSGAARGAARDAVAEARRALTRADRARLSGDQKHGAELEELAFEWAEAGRDLERTAAAERLASELEKKLTDAEAKLRTTRTLIEQAAARRARADAELAELKRGPEPTTLPSAEPSKPSAPPKPSAAPPKPSAPSTEPKPKPSAPPAAPKPSAAPPSTAPPVPMPRAVPGAAPSIPSATPGKVPTMPSATPKGPR
jgi:hypothetical protein